MLNIKWIRERHSIFQELVGCYPEKYLGCGSWGSVFTTDNPNLALKITTHKEEVKTLAIVLKLREQGVKLPGIVDIKSIIHFKAIPREIGAWGDGNFFMIVRELLKPAGRKFTSWEFNNQICYLIKREKSDYKLRAREEFKLKHPQIYKSMITLANNDIFLWDVRPSNVGINSNGYVVIHDVVAAGPLPKVTLPSIGAI